MNKLLVIGAPRNGSRYLTKILNHLGVDAKHHQWGEKSQVSWKAIEEKTPTAIHLIRNPIHAIPQIIQDNTNLTNYEMRYSVIKDVFNVDINQYEELDNAALSFILWNSLIVKKFSPNMKTLQVEKTHLKLGQILSDFGLETNSQPIEPFTKVTQVSVDWTKLDKNILKLLNEWCDENGYPNIKLAQENQPKIPVRPQTQNTGSNPIISGPRRRELPAPQPSIRSNVKLHMDRDQVVVTPRLYHKSIPATGPSDLSRREKSRRSTFKVK